MSLIIPEQAAPSTPASGKIIIYAKTDGKLYAKDDAGTEYQLSVSSPVSISEGGTGAASASAARTALGVPSTTEAILDTIIDAKGDLIAGSAADTPAKLTVGTNGQILVAASGETAGMKWADKGKAIVGRFYLNANSTITANTWTLVPYNATAFNTLSGTFSSSRFTPSKAGKYRVTGTCYMQSMADGDTYGAAVYKNGVAHAYWIGENGKATGDTTALISDIVQCNGSTDYIEIYGYRAAGTAITGGADGAHTYLSIEYLGED